MASEVKTLDILRVHACMGIIIVIQANLACVFVPTATVVIILKQLTRTQSNNHSIGDMDTKICLQHMHKLILIILKMLTNLNKRLI